MVSKNPTTDTKTLRDKDGALPSFFGSPKAVSRGGPNKAVVSSETGVCGLLEQTKDNMKEVASLTSCRNSFRETATPYI